MSYVLKPRNVVARKINYSNVATFGNFNPFKSNIILTIATAKRFDPVPVSQPLLIVLLRFKDARSYLDALIGHKICSFKCTK